MQATFQLEFRCDDSKSLYIRLVGIGIDGQPPNDPAHPPEASAVTPGLLLPLRLCIEKVVHHWDDDRRVLHERDVGRVGQDGQS